MKLSVLLAAALLLVAVPAAAEDPPDFPGAHIVHDYVLTMDKISAYERGYDALHAAIAADLDLKREFDAWHAEKDPQIADTVAKMAHHPRIFAFFEKEGLSAQEAALLPIVVKGGCAGLHDPAILAKFSVVISPDHVEFCRANEAVLTTLDFFHDNVTF